MDMSKYFRKCLKLYEDMYFLLSNYPFKSYQRSWKNSFEYAELYKSLFGELNCIVTNTTELLTQNTAEKISDTLSLFIQKIIHKWWVQFSFNHKKQCHYFLFFIFVKGPLIIGEQTLRNNIDYAVSLPPYGVWLIGVNDTMEFLHLRISLWN